MEVPTIALLLRSPRNSWAPEEVYLPSLPFNGNDGRWTIPPCPSKSPRPSTPTEMPIQSFAAKICHPRKKISSNWRSFEAVRMGTSLSPSRLRVASRSLLENLVLYRIAVKLRFYCKERWRPLSANEVLYLRRLRPALCHRSCWVLWLGPEHP
jgi:hypothetical protein